LNLARSGLGIARGQAAVLPALSLGVDRAEMTGRHSVLKLSTNETHEVEHQNVSATQSSLQSDSAPLPVVPKP
jgi:hypothetical protein